MRAPLAFLGALLVSACGAGSAPPAQPQQLRVMRALPAHLPDTTGWGVHVLTLERAPDGALWAGTFGRGIFVLRRDTAAWDDITPRENDTTSISWGYVNSVAFARGGAVWYGTVGNGFGRSTDGGRSWRNWTFDQLGPEWQYVAADGIATHGDTVLIATADGLRMTWDGGERWRCVQSSAEAASATASPRDGCTERIAGLPTKYLLSIDVSRNGTIWVGHLQGVSTSRDGGRTWHHLDTADGMPRERVRAITVDQDSLTASLWVATETEIYVDSSVTGKFKKAEIRLPGWPRLPGSPRAIIPSPGTLLPSIALSFGLAVGDEAGGYRIYYLSAGERYRPAADIWGMAWWGPPAWPIGASSAGLNRVLAGEASEIPPQATRSAPPEEPRHTWFARPIAADANPYIDATYRYGSTMGGNFQQHQGVEFNNPAGTPVHAIGDGAVVFAGQAEQGSNTVAIRHDRQWQGQHVFSTYYHNSALDVTVGQRVRAGDVVARVGHTGRATNDHLHLEVHVAPSEDVNAIVNPQERFPPHTVNPQLWIEPMPGTGTVAGTVVDSAGNPVRGARIHGLVLGYPEETPFSFIETYGDRARSDPAYNEHFAVGDVPPGDYLVGVQIDGARVWRRVAVQAGRVTFVEFAP